MTKKKRKFWMYKIIAGRKVIFLTPYKFYSVEQALDWYKQTYPRTTWGISETMTAEK